MQIYCDFSAYSDIARGLAKLMGFELMVNFRLPYTALNPSDFWNRWHISLSTWLRDYLYIPLGGNRKGTFNTYRNLTLTMILGGLWHGAAWNFVLWGVYHGFILVLFRRFEKRPIHAEPWSGAYPKTTVVAKWVITFTLIMYSWLLFRSASLSQIIYMTTHLFDQSRSGGALFYFLFTIIFTSPLFVVQYFQYRSRDLLILTKLPWVGQVVVAVGLFTVLMIFGAHTSTEFIYFQF